MEYRKTSYVVGSGTAATVYTVGANLQSRELQICPRSGWVYIQWLRFNAFCAEGAGKFARNYKGCTLTKRKKKGGGEGERVGGFMKVEWCWNV